ncbi:MAG: NUDIX domain-containing protein [Candidatus Marsarchaeota archaeon]|nr:NUDIX domain-containing protein [Candidatus Marsarchaeota archaeon]
MNWDGTYLFLKRADRGFWEFPKGHQEKDEKDFETLYRELKEETGIEELQVIKDVCHESRYKNSKGNNRIIIVYFVKVRDPNIVISDEHSEFRWFNYDDALRALSDQHDWQKFVIKAEELRHSGLW